ncbi:hypothetical protein EI546_00650 [Aequorivita sp. H23M31]|uniref:Lipoprotein n=1 Tax=Aequorivita ciconiae TaxID=2494375 RepID=A0A451FSF0_9FLAO|nr:hypothetical protein [Aequorivita sp. H23M31]QAA80334.1 hypothetical protein EI546_00650 [Aequorivita sp. H23M31]
MRQIGTLIFGILLFISCGSVKDTKDAETSEFVGNDKDKHGCISSAGYTWSELNQNCIRVFAEGHPLKPVDKNDKKVAFIVFNEDKSKLELFLPDSKATTILSQLENGNYGSKDIIYDENDSSLIIDGTMKYKLE